MKVLILGSNGMIGNAIYRKLITNNEFDVLNFDRRAKEDKLKLDLKDPKKIKNFINYNEPEVVINCVGIIKQKKAKKSDVYATNSFFPNQLNYLSTEFNFKLIQISTDCVFSGSKGFYTENDTPDATDDYGISKSLGEICNNNNLTIRTSCIGHENHKHGLLEWFLNQRNDVEGYKKVFFSGLTVLELGKIIVDYILPRNNLNGLFNIAGQTISKFQLLKIIADVYQKPIEIIPNELINIDRSLDASKFNKLTGYESQPWPELVKAMHDFNFSK